MSKEDTPRQFDMFLKDYVDNRSIGQKRREHDRGRLQQTALFSINDMLQLGANARPWLNEMPRPLLELEIQEVRTEEQIERDRRREAEALTQAMFVTPAATIPEASAGNESEDEAGPVALFRLGKEDLLAAYPDRKDQIDQMTEAEIRRMGCEVEAALQPIYRMVLTLALAAHLTACGQKTVASPSSTNHAQLTTTVV